MLLVNILGFSLFTLVCRRNLKALVPYDFLIGLDIIWELIIKITKIAENGNNINVHWLNRPSYFYNN